MPDDPNVQKNALMLLEALYRDAAADFTQPTNFLAAGQKIGLSTSTATSANTYLQTSGLVQTQDPLSKITPAGLYELAQVKTNHTQPSAHLPAYVTINNYNVQNPVNSPVAMAGGGATISQTTNYSSSDLGEIRRVIDLVEQHLSDLALNERAEKNARAMMASIRAQFEAAEPNSTVLREAGRSLRTIVEGAVGSLAASAVQTKWPAIVAGLAALF